MSDQFIFDKESVPDVKFSDSWGLVDGGDESLYKAGEWTFSLHDDQDPEFAKNAAYAWIAWYEFLVHLKYAKENPTPDIDNEELF
jgi:hypothetical protein